MYDFLREMCLMVKLSTLHTDAKHDQEPKQQICMRNFHRASQNKEMSKTTKQKSPMASDRAKPRMAQKSELLFERQVPGTAKH